MYRNKAEMKECKKTTGHLQNYTADLGQIFAFFLSCFQVHPYLKRSLVETFPFRFVLSSGVSKPTSK